uniref:NADH-ubiquinone oxidoreductase chain 6 n=1 Tax=Ophioplinthus gelida TaxID=696348 RepID=A0A3G2WI07_9ECHI|nr:NADH dehydrogenase subunit 6 [Ophioplinthus gelida]AYO99593.1 NADH dehydrogenase subunit 6 [Ophioplinthus gelida]
MFGGLVLVFSGSPFYGLLGVLFQSLGFLVYLLLWGMPFFSLVIILIYVGGMMVVFLFSTILSAERYPGTSWGEIIFFLLGGSLVFSSFNFSWHFGDLNLTLCTMSNELGLLGVFNGLGVVTCLVGFILLLALIIVLVLAFEHGMVSLRAL